MLTPERLVQPTVWVDVVVHDVVPGSIGRVTARAVAVVRYTSWWTCLGSHVLAAPSYGEEARICVCRAHGHELVCTEHGRPY